MDTEHAAAADLELLRAAFPDGEPLAWDGDPKADEKPDELYEAISDNGSIVPGTEGCGRIWMISGEGAAAYGAESGRTTAEPGFAGWVRYWVEGRDWFDAATED